MNYVVLDLEWNQSSTGAEAEVEKLPFEIIEIGAVKLNNERHSVSEFNQLIRPVVYRRMNRITGKLVNINMEELSKGRPFYKVAREFLAWCVGESGLPYDKGGLEDVTFCTWGPLDLWELQRNMAYYGMPALSQNSPLAFLDVQKLFSIAYEDRKTRRSLEWAVDFLGIEKDIPFHRAFSDAYYTAKVLERIEDTEVLKNVSYDLFTPPATRKDEVKVQFDTYFKYISRTFADKTEAFADKEVASSKCYLCHRNLRKKIKWFSPNSKHYYCVAQCEFHGYLKGKIRVRKALDGSVFIVKTTRFITPKELEEIAARKEHTKAVQRKKRHKT